MFAQTIHMNRLPNIERRGNELSEFELSPFVRSIFEGYKSARKDEDFQRPFDELGWTPFLFSSDYLGELYGVASTKEQHESILDHLYRHRATEVESYQNIEQKIIDKYYKPEPQKAKLYSINGKKRGWRK